MGYCFGIDIGGTTVKIGLAAEDGALLEGWEIPTRREPTPEGLLLDIRVSILDRLDRLDTKRTVKKAKADSENGQRLYVKAYSLFFMNFLNNL